MSLKKTFFSLELPNHPKGIWGKKQSSLLVSTAQAGALTSPYPGVPSEESLGGSVLSSITWCHRLDPVCVCKPKCFSQHLRLLHTEPIYRWQGHGWVLSQQLWRGKKESTCEGQPGWAPSACAPDLGTCPSCGTSAFCVSLLGSDSLAGVTWTLLGAFFPSSAKAMRRNAGFSHPGWVSTLSGHHLPCGQQGLWAPSHSGGISA